MATSANMQFAMKALVEAFESSSKIKCNIILGSSGKLTAQIKEGAPYDLFFSADLKYPQALYQANLTSAEPVVYAYGQLVLWAPHSQEIPALGSEQINHVAIPNPETAPYGRAAMEYLRSGHFLEKVEPKLVFGESVAQTNQFITSGAAELGFTSLSVIQEKANSRGSYKILPQSTYAPIVQAYVMLNTRPEMQEASELFLAYVNSSSGKEILTKFGYLTERP